MVYDSLDPTEKHCLYDPRANRMKHINPIVSGQEEQEGNKRKSKNISEVHQGKISTSHNYKQSYLKSPNEMSQNKRN